MEKAPEAFRTISEVAAELDVPQHVLRFWETRFRDIKPMKRGGGRRYYRPDDVSLLRGIRHLLYGEGYTIRGVQRIIREQGIKFVQAVWQPGAQRPAHGHVDEPEELTEEPDTRARQAKETERSRGRLLSLLPSLLGDRSKRVPSRSLRRPTFNRSHRSCRRGGWCRRRPARLPHWRATICGDCKRRCTSSANAANSLIRRYAKPREIFVWPHRRRARPCLVPP